jgi:hypothetical protein
VVALDLDLAVLRASAGAARFLQRGGERGEGLGGVLEAAGDRDRLAGAALAVDAYADRLTSLEASSRSASRRRFASSGSEVQTSFDDIRP